MSVDSYDIIWSPYASPGYLLRHVNQRDGKEIEWEKRAWVVFNPWFVEGRHHPSMRRTVIMVTIVGYAAANERLRTMANDYPSHPYV